MTTEPSTANHGAKRFAWAMTFCREAHLRLTAPREQVLRFLSEHRLPVSIEMMARAGDFARHCADTTIYRTLMLFREVELVRQINLPGKTSYFVLNMPGEPCDFLVCRCCGRVQELPPSRAVLRLEQEVTERSGYAAIYHELELYGICPRCQTASRNATRTTKLASFKRPLAHP